MNELLQTSDFLGKARRRMRFGEFSRAPLLLLRLEWKGETVACDWMMRPADAWDVSLPAHLADEHRTLQALRDALNLRDILFASFPSVTTADLRMFRAGLEQRLELMLTGCVNRSDEVLRRVPSVAMRARLCGFRFNLVEGALASMSPAPLGCS